MKLKTFNYDSDIKKLNAIWLQKKYNLTTIIFLLIFIISTSITAQKIQSPVEIGFPIVENYVSKEYSANVQNWAIVQDHRGVMYFGNGEGVLEYDGVSWR
jgi:hypothetical protein